ncbi:hypothetical protein DVH05_012604 [Phytophthora capsici]|nr:hypothetical protein DVH05_012604 [Phytophthora capsici]
MEVGISLDQESPSQLAEKRKAREAEEAFHEKVAQLEEATQTAHKEYSERLRSVYSASTAKKMRLTSKKSPVKTGETSESRRSNEALENLVVAAAATKQIDGSGTSRSKVKEAKRFSRQEGTGTQLLSHLHKAHCVDSCDVFPGTDRSPIQVHDPALTKAVDKLAGKLTQLLNLLQATSDTAAAEPILAAAATIALEATEMRRNRDVAMARMAEIEEHRQQIMQGLLEYEKRKEQREIDEESKEGDGVNNPSPSQDSDSKVDDKLT